MNNLRNKSAQKAEFEHGASQTLRKWARQDAQSARSSPVGSRYYKQDMAKSKEAARVSRLNARAAKRGKRKSTR